MKEEAESLMQRESSLGQDIKIPFFHSTWRSESVNMKTIERKKGMRSNEEAK